MCSTPRAAPSRPSGRRRRGTSSRGPASTGSAPTTTGDVDRILVPLSGDVADEHILSFADALLGDRDIGVTLFLATDSEEVDTGRLDTAAETLRNGGISVQTTAVAGTSPFAALIDEAPSHDVIVMGERAPSLGSLVFGEESERVASESVGPVLVVRAEQAPE